ncbi:heme peroxidase [Violaceomyces palustris]|uniref:Heme peroxidase n=1 Tax=Violaceomyces palustris TaxID=1673888 RepID=A0ACD0P876_9BASI|nr:heme peroxidase [Violaceomyces palustris]
MNLSKLLVLGLLHLLPIGTIGGPVFVPDLENRTPGIHGSDRQVVKNLSSRDDVTKNGEKDCPISRLLLARTDDSPKEKRLSFPKFTSPQTEAQQKYQSVYNAIAQILSQDHRSYGPILVRLAWHTSGTYDRTTDSGGSNGGTIRFPKEGNYSSNNGLDIAMSYLEPIKKQFPFISYSDLYTFGGVVAIQEMGGPKIPWRPGRIDKGESESPPDGRLPRGFESGPKLRKIFDAKTFPPQQMVALIGAHVLGGCHKSRSGFAGPWTDSPTTFNNQYYLRLANDEYVIREKMDTLPQFQDQATGRFMMLLADMALVDDPTTLPYVKLYASSQAVWFIDFAFAFSKLLELGVPFKNFQGIVPIQFDKKSG